MKWFKLLIGLVLIPTLVAVGWAFCDMLTHGWLVHEWHSSWFWAFLVGFILWNVAYFLFPRPMWIYVFGHELTHALAIYLQGGKVLGFRVATYGGHVKTDTINWWVTLAPYFIPIYCLIWIALWMTVNLYFPLHPYQWLLYGGVGLTWGFHLTFTVSMIKLGQTDIESQGFLFSMVIILLFNLLLIESFLTGALDHYSLLLWLRELWARSQTCYLATWHGMVNGSIWCWHELVKLCHNSRPVSR